MIYFITGGLGSGKTMYGVRKICRSLLEGKAVASNVLLVDGWEYRVLRHSQYYRFGSADSRRAQRDEIMSRYCFIDNVADLLGARLYGFGESRGVRVVDEAHNALHNRDWDKQDQKEALTKLTLGRKRGWEDYIISQHADNTDAIARRIASVEIRLVNWQQLTRVPVLGTRLLPFPVFLAQAFPLNAGKLVRSSVRPLYRELYTVGWYGKCYDTFQDYGSEDASEDASAIWLPLKLGAGGPGDAPRVSSGVASAAPSLSLAHGSGGNRNLVAAPPDGH